MNNAYRIVYNIPIMYSGRQLASVRSQRVNNKPYQYPLEEQTETSETVHDFFAL